VVGDDDVVVVDEFVEVVYYWGFEEFGFV